MSLTSWSRICGALLVMAAAATSVVATNITNVVEINGDSGATYIPTQWTGQTFSATTAAVPYKNTAVGDQITVPYFVPSGSGSSQPYQPSAYLDRSHSWANGGNLFNLFFYPSMPSYLVGGEYLMVPQGLRDNATLQLDVTVTNPSTVYLLIDNRLGEAPNPGDNGNQFDPPTFDASHMAWVAAGGWTPVVTGLNHVGDTSIPDEIVMDESQDNMFAANPNPAFGNVDSPFSIYAKQVPAGTFSLLQADKNAGNLNMYGVVIAAVPEPAAALLMLLGTMAGLLGRRRTHSA